MIPFREALDLVLKHAPRLDVEACHLETASDRVLRQKIRAARSFPPFDRVIMDDRHRRVSLFASQNPKP